MKQPWKTISFPTKIALYFSLGLVVFGALSFAVLEWNGTMNGMSWFGKFTTSVFQSVTRTSGFNTVDIGSVGMPMLFLLMVLMFIGASSSSTGGGIKTSTFAIVLADVWRTVRGADHTQIFKRTINSVLQSRAYSVLLFFIVGNVIGIFVLTITESDLMKTENISFFDLAFEHVSAMGTVGLSTGVTPLLSGWGKVVLSVAMFVGRVGTLTVAFAVGGRQARHISNILKDTRWSAEPMGILLVRFINTNHMGTRVTPYVSPEEENKKNQVERMFDGIAHRYDFLNHLFSFGIDVRWRKACISMLKKEDPRVMLDVATGTADLPSRRCVWV